MLLCWRALAKSLDSCNQQVVIDFLLCANMLLGAGAAAMNFKKAIIQKTLPCPHGTTYIQSTDLLHIVVTETKFNPLFIKWE